MRITKCKFETSVSILAFLLFSIITILGATNAVAQKSKPIVIKDYDPSIDKRMLRTISLDVRDMNVVDVIKFLALKGDFNVVISPTVEGRATVLLNTVSIKDALDIVVISNQLAYKIQNTIVQIMSAAEYEAMFGKGFSDKTSVQIIRLKYAKPSYVLAALDSIKSNVGKIIIDEDTGSVVMIDTNEAIGKMLTAIKEIEKPLATYVYTLQYAEADVVANELRGRIDAKTVGSVMSDERSNKIIVRAFPDRIAEIEHLIEELDTQTKEVLVDARILQVTFKPKYDVGVDWQFDFRKAEDKNLKKVDFKNFNFGIDNSTIAGSDSLFSQFGQIAIGDIAEDSFEMTIRSFESVSDTKILSNPQILVTNNEEARIHIGDTVPYIISTTSGTGDNAITSEDVRFVDVGLKLNVTPIINDDDFVTLMLRPEISTVTATVTSQGGGIPQITKTEVETTVIVKDGNTIILGGLKKDDKSHVKQGLPVLMNVPFLGTFFSRTDDDITTSEIVIFITPHIVKNGGDYMTPVGAIKPFKKYSTE